MVSDGTDAVLLAALQTALTAEGVVLELIAPKVGGVKLSDGAMVPAKQKVNGGPSVPYDAVAVLVSAEGAALLSNEATAKDFLNDAYAHAKFIGFVASAEPLLVKPGLTEPDAGFVALKTAKDVATFVTKCRMLRFWEREPKVHAMSGERSSFLKKEAKNFALIAIPVDADPAYGSHDPCLWGCGLGERLEGASPTEVVRQIVGGHTVKAMHPLLQAGVVGVDIIDVEFWRARLLLPGAGRTCSFILARRAKAVIPMPPSQQKSAPRLTTWPKAAVMLAASRCLVPESHGAILTREAEEALWQAVFTAQPEQRREFEPSSKRRKRRAAPWPGRKTQKSSKSIRVTSSRDQTPSRSAAARPAPGGCPVAGGCGWARAGSTGGRRGWCGRSGRGRRLG